MNDLLSEALRLGVEVGELVATCDLCGCPTEAAGDSYECVAHGPRTGEQAQFWDAETYAGKKTLQ